MKKPNLKAFAEKAIHTSCDAFYCDLFFGDLQWAREVSKGRKVNGMYREFYPEVSCKEDHPKIIDYEDGHIQGRFHYVNDSTGDLYVVCSHYAEIGEEYYCFFDVEWDQSDKYHSSWVVWTPNSEHYNDRKKEEV